MKFLSLLLVAIVFFGSFSLGFKVRANELGINFLQIGNASDLPVLIGTNNFPILSGQGIIAVDADSNVTLFEKNSNAKLLPASTTKILTALTCLDYYKLDDVLTAKNPVVEGQRMGLVDGEQMTVQNLLKGLLIYSANDAAIVLAQNYPGGIDAFVSAMNAKAASLHLENSHFTNPIGLDNPDQYTTALDMVRLGKVAMHNENFAQIVGTKETVVSDVSGKFSYKLKNINELLKSVEGVEGIKTGWTEGAKENLITYVNRNNRKIYIALLGSADRFGETKELINWIYANYVWQRVGYIQKAVSQVRLF